MIAETGITGGEAAAEVMIGMKVTGTVGGRETIGVEAGAWVQVPITLEAVVEAGQMIDMMMDEGTGAGAGQLIGFNLLDLYLIVFVF